MWLAPSFDAVASFTCKLMAGFILPKFSDIILMKWKEVNCFV